jgi:chromosome partitioning protein
VTKAPADASRPASSATDAPAPAKPGRSPRKKKPEVPAVPGRARIISIANQKGGVGKSTTAVSLGAALADIGYRVLVIDLDPQGNASTGMGIRHEAREITVYDVVVADAAIQAAIVPTPVDRLHAVPATIDLAGAEIELVSQFSREARLKKAIEPIAEGLYDFILLDCPPSLGLLTINALTAAEELIVPIQCEYYALEGLGQLLRNVSLVQQNINSDLRLSGIVMTMFDPRTKLSEQVVQEVQRYFGDLVYHVIIPRTVRLSEAPGFGQPITVYDPRSKGAESYRELAREVALRPPPEAPMPSFEDLPAVVITPMGGNGSTPEGPEPELASAEEDEQPEPVEMAEPESELEPPATTSTPASAGSGTDEQETAHEAPAAEPLPPEVDVNDRRSRGSVEVERERREPSASIATAVDPEGWLEPAPEPEPRVKPLSRPPAPGELPEHRVVVIDESTDTDDEAGHAEPPAAPTSDVERGRSTDIGGTLDSEKAPKRRWRLFRRGE